LIGQRNESLLLVQVTTNGQFEKFSKRSDWLEKIRPSKKGAFVLIM